MTERLQGADPPADGPAAAVRRAVLACLATIVLPIGLRLVPESVPVLRPVQAWTTPYAAVQAVFSGRLTIVAWLHWSVAALLWSVALNALGAMRLRRRAGFTRPPANA